MTRRRVSPRSRMGRLLVNYYASRPWDGGHLNMVVETAAGSERYGINQDLDLRGFILGSRSRPRSLSAEPDTRDAPLVSCQIDRADEDLADVRDSLRAHDEGEQARGYSVRLLRWRKGVSIDFERSNTCSDLPFLLLDRGLVTAPELAGFVDALRAHPMPTYTQLYLLAKWEQRESGKDARDVFQDMFHRMARSHPQVLGAQSDLFAGGGVAFSGGGSHFFLYPDGEGELCCRHDWQPQLDAGYMVEFVVSTGLLRVIDGRRLPGKDSDRLLQAGIDGGFAVRNRLRCVVVGGERRYETDSGKLVATSRGESGGPA